MIRLALALILLLASTASAQVSFAPHDPGITPHLTAYREANPSKWWSWGIQVADINGDGKADIYVNTHHAEHGLAYLQQSDGSFVPLAVDPAVMPGGRPPIFADFTGNGKVDIVSTSGDHATRTKLQQPDGTFVDGQYKSVIGSRGDVLDLNGDGYLDVKSYPKGWGILEETTHVNLAPGEARFEATTVKVEVPTDIPQAAQDRLLSLEGDMSDTRNRYAGPVYWRGDLNGNGREDLVIQYGGSYGGGIYRFGMYFLRNAEGVLEDVTDTCGIPGHLLPLLPPVDTANNGRLSILTGYGSIEQAGLYAQNEDGTFTLQRIGNTIAKTTTMGRATYSGNASYFYKPYWLDLDGDGDLDCVVSARRLGWLRVYENVDGVLLDRYQIFHWDADGVDIADVNGDGRPDIVVGHGLEGQSKQAGTSVTVWRNTSTYVPPEEPEEPEEPEPEDPDAEPAPLVVRLTIGGEESLLPVEVLLNGLSVGVAGDELDVLIGTPPVEPEEPTDPEEPEEPEEPQVIQVTPETVHLIENSQEGQVFTLTEGLYRPIVILNRNRITIKGNGLAHFHGRGPQYSRHAITVRNSPSVIIDGVKCTGGNAGIGGYGSHHLTIKNCNLSNNDTWGVFTSVCDDTVIIDNVCNDNFHPDHPSDGQHGIYISNSSQRPVIERNDCSGNKRAGIQINGDRFSSGSRDGITRGAVVRENVLTDNKIGMNLDGCSDSLFEGNQIDDGMRLFKIDGGEASSRNTIRHNRIFEIRPQSAVLVRDGSQGNIFERNVIELPATHPTWAYGISVEEGDRDSSMISRCNRFRVPGAPFGGGQFGKDSRTLEQMGDEGSVIERP